MIYKAILPIIKRYYSYNSSKHRAGKPIHTWNANKYALGPFPVKGFKNDLL